MATPIEALAKDKSVELLMLAPHAPTQGTFLTTSMP